MIKLKFVSPVALLGHVQVLIIGGGDGGVARELAKHEAVKRIVQCEIDQVNLTSTYICTLATRRVFEPLHNDVLRVYASDL